jgi:hypothetical protein
VDFFDKGIFLKFLENLEICLSLGFIFYLVFY